MRGASEVIKAVSPTPPEWPERLTAGGISGGGGRCGCGRWCSRVGAFAGAGGRGRLRTAVAVSGGGRGRWVVGGGGYGRRPAARGGRWALASLRLRVRRRSGGAAALDPGEVAAGVSVSATSTNGCAGVRTRRPKGGCYNGVACGGGGAGERGTAAVTGRRGGGGAIGKRLPDRSDGRESPATWPCWLAFFCSKNGIQRFSNLPKKSFL